MRKGTFNYNQEVEEKIKEGMNDTLDKSINQLEEQLADLKEQKNKLADENADLKEVLDGFKIPQTLNVEIVPTNHKQWLKWVITLLVTVAYALSFLNIYGINNNVQLMFYFINAIFVCVVVFTTLTKLMPEYKIKIKEREKTIDKK